jgi:hypothetical protein
MNDDSENPLDRPISALQLSVRAEIWCERHGITAVRRLAAISEAEFARRGAAAAVIREITAALDRLMLDNLRASRPVQRAAARWNKRACRRTPHAHCVRCGACLLNVEGETCASCASRSPGTA